MPNTHSNARQGSEKPVLLDAIQFTVRTIEERLRFYRYLVWAICSVALGSIFLALVFRQVVVLSGFVILVPLVGGFFCLDSRRVRLWRAGVLDMARLRGLDVRDFCQTISYLPSLPAGTLKGMLATIAPDVASNDGLPSASDDPSAQDQFAARMRSHERRILIATGLLALGLTCLGGAVVYRSLLLLLVGGSCLVGMTVIRERSPR